MTARARLWTISAAVALGAFVAAAAFSAYLKPAMMVELANLVLCS